jgi:hypothetical protein
VEFGLVEFGLVEFGLVEFGLVEFGLVEFGLVGVRASRSSGRRVRVARCRALSDVERAVTVTLGVPALAC